MASCLFFHLNLRLGQPWAICSSRAALPPLLFLSDPSSMDMGVTRGDVHRMSTNTNRQKRDQEINNGEIIFCPFWRWVAAVVPCREWNECRWLWMGVAGPKVKLPQRYAKRGLTHLLSFTIRNMPAGIRSANEDNVEHLSSFAQLTWFWK